MDSIAPAAQVREYVVDTNLEIGCAPTRRSGMAP
jgi:hypothetical protein